MTAVPVWASRLLRGCFTDATSLVDPLNGESGGGGGKKGGGVRKGVVGS
jgi:hypothetical protein